MATDAKGQLISTAQITLPKGTKSFLYILCIDSQSAGLGFKCRPKLNGIPLPDSKIQTWIGTTNTLRLVRELPLKPWVFFRFPLPEGTNEITLSLEVIAPLKQSIQVEAGSWLWTEQPLQKTTLTLERGQKWRLAKASPLPFPSAIDTQREVIPLQSLRSFAFDRNTKEAGSKRDRSQSR